MKTYIVVKTNDGIIMEISKFRRFVVKNMRKNRTLQRKAERNQKRLDRKIWEALYA